MQKIGVFDSGVGGISVLREIHSLLPCENLVYVADSAHIPYGNKSPGYILARAQSICRFLTTKNAKAIVVACNTATAAAIGYLRGAYDIPIVGMEPALKPAAALTKSGVVAILATASTLKSEKFEHLADRFGKDIYVLRLPCEGWVEQIENGQIDSKYTRALVKRFVQPALDKNADTLVLGCTHYPFLISVIRDIAGAHVNIIETGTAVANQLRNRLKDESAQEGTREGMIEFYSSDRNARIESVIARLWSKPIVLLSLPDEYK